MPGDNAVPGNVVHAPRRGIENKTPQPRSVECEPPQRLGVARKHNDGIADTHGVSIGPRIERFDTRQRLCVGGQPRQKDVQEACAPTRLKRLDLRPPQPELHDAARLRRVAGTEVDAIEAV